MLSSITAVVVGVNVDAADVTLEDVEFNFDATGDDFITMLDCDAVNGMTLRNCAFLAENIAGCDEALRLDTTSDTVIEGCRFFGDFTDSCIIGEGALGTNLIIRNNDFYNADTTAGKIIDLNVAYTGKISYNSMGTLFATNVTAPFDPGSCLCNQNFMCNAVDEHGVIVPTTASA